MAAELEFPTLESPTELAEFRCWESSVYQDFIDLESGRVSLEDFDRKYLATRAILVLDVTGFTVSTINHGAIESFLRILDTHRISFPVLRECGATFVRAFADDITALFDDVDAALDSAIEIHRRIDLYNERRGERRHPPECCIGIGYGDIYEIGPNRAMGDEMNRASVLGEDLARGRETLVTEGAYQALKRRPDTKFEPQTGDDLVFPYYRALHET